MRIPPTTVAPPLSPLPVGRAHTNTPSTEIPFSPLPVEHPPLAVPLDPVEPLKQSASPLSHLKSLAKGHLKEEQQLKAWEQRLARGYLPTDLELLKIQRLVYRTTQRVELASKLITSVIQSLNQLKQTPL